MIYEHSTIIQYPGITPDAISVPWYRHSTLV